MAPVVEFLSLVRQQVDSPAAREALRAEAVAALEKAGLDHQVEAQRAVEVEVKEHVLGWAGGGTG